MIIDDKRAVRLERLARAGRFRLFVQVFHVLWLMEDRGLTFREVADASGVPISTLSQATGGLDFPEDEETHLDILDELEDGITSLTDREEQG